MRRLKKVLAAAGLILAAARAEAHPHVWIDVVSTLAFDRSGMLTALEFDWLFDPFYTAYALEDMSFDYGAADAAALDDMARGNLQNLAPYSYFFELRVDGSVQKPNTAALIATGVEDGRLRIKFRVPLAAPVDPRAGSLSFAVFDPTYYIEMLHRETGGVVFSDLAGATCSARIEQPNPDPEAVSLAAMLDQSEAGPNNDLGRLFAETVRIACE